VWLREYRQLLATVVGLPDAGGNRSGRHGMWRGRRIVFQLRAGHHDLLHGRSDVHHSTIHGRVRADLRCGPRGLRRTQRANRGGDVPGQQAAPHRPAPVTFRSHLRLLVRIHVRLTALDPTHHSSRDWRSCDRSRCRRRISSTRGRGAHNNNCTHAGSLDRGSTSLGHLVAGTEHRLFRLQKADIVGAHLGGVAESRLLCRSARCGHKDGAWPRDACQTACTRTRPSVSSTV
jgi:hypothetical protein